MYVTFVRVFHAIIIDLHVPENLMGNLIDSLTFIIYVYSYHQINIRQREFSGHCKMASN